MKISYSLLKKYLNFKITLSNLIKQLNFLGYEVKSFYSCNKQYINNLFIVAKIIKINIFYIKKRKIYIYKVKINNNKFYYVIESLHLIKKKYLNNLNNLLFKKVIIALKGALLNNHIDVNFIKFTNFKIDGVICTYYDLGLFNNLNSKIIIIYESYIKLGKYINKYLDLSDFIITINPISNRIDNLNIINIAKEIIIYNYKNKYLKKNFLIKKIFKLKLIKKNILYKKININKKYTYIYNIIKNINFNNYLPLDIYIKLYNLNIPIINPLIDIINYIYINTGLVINIINLTNNIKLKMINFNNYNYKNPLYFNSSNNFFINKINKILIEIKIYNSNYINIYKNDILNNKLTKYYPYLNNDYKSYIYSINLFIKILRLINNNKININKYIIINYQRTNLLNNYIIFNKDLIYKKIGYKIKFIIVKKILKYLNFKIIKKKNILNIYITKWRIDINNEMSLLSEIMKFYSYIFLYKNYDLKLINNNFKNYNSYDIIINKIKLYLIHNGYYEVLNNSFSDPKIQNLYFNKNNNIKIISPLSKYTSVLRQSLIFNLIKNIISNYIYNNKRLKLFEIGKCYKIINNKYIEYNNLGILILGSKFLLNWQKLNIYNFNIYDLKADSDNIFEFLNINSQLKYQYKKYNFFDNKQSLNINYLNKNIGYLGKINVKLINNNPNLLNCYFLEINLDKIINNININNNIEIKPIFYHPIITRDISLVLKNKINVNDILLLIKKKIKKYLINIEIFDIYRNKPIIKGYKNIGIKLELQDPNNKSILNDLIVNKLIISIFNILKIKYNAYLRDYNYLLIKNK